MKLKKKIIRQSFDYQAEKDYYDEASVCPNCGQIKQSVYRCTDLINPVITYASTIDGGRVYECHSCGCIWEVKAYKEKKRR